VVLLFHCAADWHSIGPVYFSTKSNESENIQLPIINAQDHFTSGLLFHWGCRRVRSEIEDQPISEVIFLDSVVAQSEVWSQWLAESKTEVGPLDGFCLWSQWKTKPKSKMTQCVLIMLEVLFYFCTDDITNTSSDVLSCAALQSMGWHCHQQPITVRFLSIFVFHVI